MIHKTNAHGSEAITLSPVEEMKSSELIDSS